ncbi:hypothetical protein ACSDQ9_00680 [Aestuariimicrobium soli]|uniref:hypothetical protein n=1 Tax=Aestuariimicrobium soli TaxID=2035834 RepID=UPI003EB8F3CC
MSCPQMWRRACASHLLVRVLPGVFVVASLADDPATLARAVLERHPNAVVTGQAAAALSYLPRLPVPTIEVAAKAIGDGHPYTFSQETIPPEWVVEADGIRRTSVAMTAVDLIPRLGADPVDEALRQAGRHSGAMLRQMWAALAARPGRPGNRVRAEVLHDSRDLPWSAAERLSHRHLRGAHITGWTTNHPVTLAGELLLLDVAFAARRSCLEIDGWATHCDRESFERDRHRRNLLNDHGWQVRQFTWRMLQDRAAFIASVRHLVAP